MDANYQGFYQEIINAIDGLQNLQARTGPQTSVSHRYISQIVKSHMVLLTAAANWYPNKPKRYLKGDLKNLNAIMTTLHRSFFSEIHAVTEKGLIEICQERNIKVECSKKKNITDLLSKIEEETSGNPKVKFCVNKLRTHTSSFQANLGDSLNAVLKQSRLSTEEKKKWRKFFEALSILRNKISHGDYTILPSEREKLIAGGFAPLLNNSGEIIVNPRNYHVIAHFILNFFDAVVK